MFGLGGGEIIVLLILALIIIGPKKLPELAKGLGKGMKEFQKARQDFMSEINKATVEEPRIQSSKIENNNVNIEKEVEANVSESKIGNEKLKDKEKLV